MKTILSFLKLIRAVNLFILALSLSLFYYLILVVAHKNILHTYLVPFTHLEFALFVFAVVCIAAAGNIINDYFDYELDKVYKPNRPLANADFSLDFAMYLHAILALVGIGIGFYLGYKANNYKLGYLFIISTLLLYVYSAFLKKIPLAGNIVVALLSAFSFMLIMLFELKFLNTISFDGAGYALAVLLLQVKFYGGFAFLSTLAREIVKDLEDYEGDKAFEIRTLAVEYGIVPAKGLAALVLVLLFAGVGYFCNSFIEANAMKEFAYLFAAVEIPTVIAIGLLLRAKNKTDFARISLLLKVIMLLGILSIPVFYYLNLQTA